MGKIIAKITVNDNRFFIFESKPDNIKLIEKLLTFEDTSQCFFRGKFDKNRIKYITFLTKDENNPTAALIPIGFLVHLKKYLDGQGAKYKIVDQREKPNFNFTDEQIKSNLDYLTLYPYQVEAVKKALEKGNGIIKSTTGSGKCVSGDTEIEIEFDDSEIDL